MTPPSVSAEIHEPLEAIEKGHAREAVLVASANLSGAIGQAAETLYARLAELEAVAFALARALDGETSPRT